MVYYNQLFICICIFCKTIAYYWPLSIESNACEFVMEFFNFGYDISLKICTTKLILDGYIRSWCYRIVLTNTSAKKIYKILIVFDNLKYLHVFRNVFTAFSWSGTYRFYHNMYQILKNTFHIAYQVNKSVFPHAICIAMMLSNSDVTHFKFWNRSYWGTNIFIIISSVINGCFVNTFNCYYLQRKANIRAYF